MDAPSSTKPACEKAGSATVTDQAVEQPLDDLEGTPTLTDRLQNWGSD